MLSADSRLFSKLYYDRVLLGESAQCIRERKRSYVLSQFEHRPMVVRELLKALIFAQHMDMRRLNQPDSGMQEVSHVEH